MFTLVFFLSIIDIKAQHGDVLKENIFNSFDFGTLDLALWNDSVCFMSESPISRIEGFERLFSSVEDDYLHVTFMPTIEDKKYGLNWMIINSKLYLCAGVYFPYIKEKSEKLKKLNNMARDTLEAFTHCKFIKKEQWDGVPDAHIEKTAQGLIEAKWYTGTLYVVPTKAFNKKQPPCSYSLTFEKGNLVSQELIMQKQKE